MSKTKIQLQEDIAQLEADLSTVVDELTEVKTLAREEIDRAKAELKDEAAQFEVDRQKQLKQAREAYDKLLTKAMLITMKLQEQNPDQLGVAGQVARDAQLNTIKEIFGESQEAG